MIEIGLVAALSFLISVGLTWLVRKWAIASGTLDVPSARSSHSIPTPRGGGVAIVIASLFGVVCTGITCSTDAMLLVALTIGGIPVAFIGFLDDRYTVPPLVRFVVHCAAGTFAVHMLDGLSTIRFGAMTYNLAFVCNFLAVVGVVWVLNLFNFMDGIDGIAGSEALFVMIAGGCLAYLETSSGNDYAAAWVIAAAALGFLVWNWPPAKIFMGDVGSGFLGYVVAVLALASARENSVMLFVWLILGGVFFVDATVTLLRRLIGGERVYEAHRSHAYQRLSRRWSSHLRVTVLVLVINTCWLLPMAWACLRFPQWAIAISAAALAPLVVLALLAGAGRSEVSTR